MARPKDYAGAQQLYMQSLVGLDFGSGEEEKAEAAAAVQVPVLTNLSACFLNLKQWHKVRSCQLS